jgi:hypothetical protein
VTFTTLKPVLAISILIPNLLDLLLVKPAGQ